MKTEFKDRNMTVLSKIPVDLGSYAVFLVTGEES